MEYVGDKADAAKSQSVEPVQPTAAQQPVTPVQPTVAPTPVKDPVKTAQPAVENILQRLSIKQNLVMNRHQWFKRKQPKPATEKRQLSRLKP